MLLLHGGMQPAISKTYPTIFFEDSKFGKYYFSFSLLTLIENMIKWDADNTLRFFNRYFLFSGCFVYNSNRLAHECNFHPVLEYEKWHDVKIGDVLNYKVLKCKKGVLSVLLNLDSHVFSNPFIVYFREVLQS